MRNKGKDSDPSSSDHPSSPTPNYVANVPFPQSLTSANTALHGGIRRLDAGLDDLLPSSSATSGNLKRILAGLQAQAIEGPRRGTLQSGGSNEGGG